MVKIPLSNIKKEQIPARKGRGKFPFNYDIMSRLGLEINDVFVNDYGETLIVEKSPFSDKPHLRELVQPKQKDTNLEKIVENILIELGYKEDIDYEKQKPLEKYSFHLDFAFPKLRYAIEPGARFWHPQERDRKKESRLKEIGWIVLWLYEDTLNDYEFAKQIIDESLRNRRRSEEVDEEPPQERKGPWGGDFRA